MSATSHPMDDLILGVATSYQALSYDLHQRLSSALAGDHNIAQAVDTARAIVAELSGEQLALVLARLLVTSDDVAGTARPTVLRPMAAPAAVPPSTARRRSDSAAAPRNFCACGHNTEYGGTVPHACPDCSASPHLAPTQHTHGGH